MIKEILKLADEANQGLTNALEAYIELKKLEKVIADCIESVKPGAVQEADKYHEKVFELKGAQVEKKRAPGRWDFKAIRQWNEKTAEVKKIEELAKNAYKMIQEGKLAEAQIEGDAMPPAKYTEGGDTIAIKIL